MPHDTDSSAPKKVFDFFVGCAQIVGTIIGVIGLVISFVALVWAVRNPNAVPVIINIISGAATATPKIIILPSETPLPTYTPSPTYTPMPTNPPLQTNTPIPTATATLFVPPADGILFQDNFDSGASVLWQPSVTNGTWRVINGRYTLTGETKQIWSYSLVGDTNWNNYVIDVDFSADLDEFAGAAILVRAGGPNKLSLAFIYSGGRPKWIAWQNGGWQTIAESRKSSYNPGHMRVEVNGSTFIGSMSGFDDLFITDTTTTNGQIGLGVWCRGIASCPTFDNVKVTYLP